MKLTRSAVLSASQSGWVVIRHVIRSTNRIILGSRSTYEDDLNVVDRDVNVLSLPPHVSTQLWTAGAKVVGGCVTAAGACVGGCVLKFWLFPWFGWGRLFWFWLLLNPWFWFGCCWNPLKPWFWFGCCWNPLLLNPLLLKPWLGLLNCGYLESLKNWFPNWSPTVDPWLKSSGKNCLLNRAASQLTNKPVTINR